MHDSFHLQGCAEVSVCFITTCPPSYCKHQAMYFQQTTSDSIFVCYFILCIYEDWADPDIIVRGSVEIELKPFSCLWSLHGLYCKG